MATDRGVSVEVFVDGVIGVALGWPGFPSIGRVSSNGCFIGFRTYFLSYLIYFRKWWARQGSNL
jgi:hypothetical protein